MIQIEDLINNTENKIERPPIVESITYKLKSSFVHHSIYITLGYVTDGKGNKRPVEIFINSKDLTHSAEYAVLTRLISAIFRHASNPTFILDELRGIYDPRGGVFKNGRYYPSLYAEIADVMEQFFRDIGLLRHKNSEGKDISPKRKV